MWSVWKLLIYLAPLVCVGSATLGLFTTARPLFALGIVGMGLFVLAAKNVEEDEIPKNE